jgi:hypothetical protein
MDGVLDEIGPPRQSSTGQPSGSIHTLVLVAQCILGS